MSCCRPTPSSLKRWASRWPSGDDAAFAKPELYDALEEREVRYAIRLIANDNLERNIRKLLTRLMGKPSYKPVVRYHSFLYQAAS